MKNPESFSTRNLNLLNFENYRLVQIETNRKKNKRNFLVLLFIAVGIVALMLQYKWYIFGGIAIFVELIVFLILKSLLNTSYEKEFKSQILSKLVSSIDESFAYFPENALSLEDFKHSEFFKGANSARGEDFFSGMIGEHAFRGSELDIESGSGKSRSRVFKGLFFVVEFPLQEALKVDILPDVAESLMGKFGTFLQSNNFLRDTLVKFEDESFEKKFVVYSNHPDEARKLVCPELRLCLVNLKNNFKQNIFLTFHQNQMYFGVENNNDFFKVSIKKSLLDNELIHQYFQEFIQYINALSQILTSIKNYRKI